MLTIFVPSAYEAADFIKSLSKKRSGRVGLARYYEGNFAGVETRVVICGMGQPHSALRIEAALEKFSAAGETAPVLLAGTGGGLDPSLKREDIVYLLGDIAGAEPAILEAAAATKIPARKIFSVFTSEIVVDTPAAKLVALEKFGAPIVDMETGPFLELTKKYNRTAAVIRVISDDFDEIFPGDLLGYGYDFSTGKDTPFRFVWHMARHPGDILRLRKFLAPLPACRARLTEFVRHAAQTLGK